MRFRGRKTPESAYTRRVLLRPACVPGAQLRPSSPLPRRTCDVSCPAVGSFTWETPPRGGPKRHARCVKLSERYLYTFFRFKLSQLLTETKTPISKHAWLKKREGVIAAAKCISSHLKSWWKFGRSVALAASDSVADSWGFFRPVSHLFQTISYWKSCAHTGNLVTALEIYHQTIREINLVSNIWIRILCQRVISNDFFFRIFFSNWKITFFKIVTYEGKCTLILLFFELFLVESLLWHPSELW